MYISSHHSSSSSSSSPTTSNTTTTWISIIVIIGSRTFSSTCRWCCSSTQDVSTNMDMIGECKCMDWICNKEE